MTHPFHAIRLPAALVSVTLTLLGPMALGAETKTIPLEFKMPMAKFESIEPPDDSVAAWRTEHFSLLSDETIPREVLQRFATTIESVPKVMEVLSIPLLGMPMEIRPIIRLCRDEEHFAQFGGPASSAGYYQPRENRILIRADLFLNPQRSGSARLKDPPEEDLLVHELCHLVMAGNLGHAPPWLSEGIAEYLSIAHQRGGHYRFDNSPQFIRNQFAKHLPTKDLQALELPSLRHALTLSHRGWSEETANADPADRYLPYATSLLYVHYLMEGGKARRDEFARYLTALKTPRSRRQPTHDLNWEDSEQIQARLTDFWSSRGLKIRFLKS